MIDISKAQWEFSKEDKYIFDWFEQNGFDAVLEKQCISKLIVTVSKDGVTDKVSFPSGKYDVKGYMELYGKQFELLCKLQSFQVEKGR